MRASNTAVVGAISALIEQLTPAEKAQIIVGLIS